MIKFYSRSNHVNARNGHLLYETHAPHLNPTEVDTHGATRRRWPDVRLHDGKGTTEIVGVTVKALMDALIEDPVTRRYLGTGVDHFRELERNNG